MPKKLRELTMRQVERMLLVSNVLQLVGGSYVLVSEEVKECHKGCFYRLRWADWVGAAGKAIQNEEAKNLILGGMK